MAALDVEPVPSCVAVTVTAGRTAPEASVTVPTIAAVSICALADGASESPASNVRTTRNAWILGFIVYLRVLCGEGQARPRPMARRLRRAAS